MSIHWNPNLSVGNDRIDNDHKHLIELINLAERALEAKNKNLLSNQLGLLEHYADIHFKSEERIAEAVQFPMCEHIHLSHLDLRRVLQACKHKVDNAVWNDKLADDELKLLRTWLIDHVIKEDLKMKPYLLKHARSLSL